MLFTDVCQGTELLCDSHSYAPPPKHLNQDNKCFGMGLWNEIGAIRSRIS